MADQKTEKKIERLERQFAPTFAREARRAMQCYIDANPLEYFNYDHMRDEMIDAVEHVMFGATQWYDIAATDISDIAHEVADEVLASDYQG